MSDNIAASAKVLFTREQIEERAAQLGKQISDDYAGESLYLIGTLRGAVVWMADLMKNITNDTEIDFIVASSYGSGTTSTGLVSIKYLKEHLADRNPKSIRICTLLDKPSRRTVDIEADYVGFSIENLFVIGYGLDYDQKYRNLPYISYLEG